VSRPNKQREVFAEDHLAARIASEREARGWSLEGLAKRMTDAGCPIDQSAIFKIERTTPRRRIVVDEMVTFAKVFGVPVVDLLLPPEVAAYNELGRLVMEWDQAVKAVDKAEQTRAEAWEAVRAFVATKPDSEGALERVMEDWSAVYWDTTDDRKFQIAHQMWNATNSKLWADRLKVEIDRVAYKPTGGK